MCVHFFKINFKKFKELFLHLNIFRVYNYDYYIYINVTNLIYISEKLSTINLFKYYFKIIFYIFVIFYIF